jgi:predicted RNase H-like nuclease (RuvC/YqgF family)
MFRKLCAILGCAAIGAFLLCHQTPIEAQGKKDDQAKQIQQLKKSIQDKENQINKLELQVQKQKLDYEYYKKKNPGAPKLQKDLDKANQTIKDKEALITTLQKPASQATKDLTKDNEALRRKVRDLEAFKKAPFVHSVILKLKKEDDEQVKTIAAEADKTLAKIPGVRAVWLGKPAEYGTPDLAQKDYQIGIVVLLDDADALLKFLDDPLHKQFNDKMGEYWERPVVYDFQRDGEAAKKE